MGIYVQFFRNRLSSLIPIAEPKKIAEKGFFDYRPKKSDPISEMIDYAQAFTKARINGKIDIKTTHLPYLSSAVEENFNALSPSGQTNRDVENFRQEMKERISQSQVTYEWWVCFNLRLSILATPPSRRSGWAGNYLDRNMASLVENNGWRKHAATLEVLKSSSYLSPLEYFLFPTHLGDLKINDMNRMFMSGVFAIGLSNKPLMVDGRLMWPDQFFRHDLVHFGNELHFLDGESITVLLRPGKNISKCERP